MKLKNTLRQKVAVVIPLYEDVLTRYETFSLQQCLRILGAHPIVFLAPEDWSSRGQDWVTAIQLQLPMGQSEISTNLKVEYFPTECFGSVASYNRLMLSREFYQRFVDYEYILIHQLDAFVFSDQLLAWCQRGYDYIGAPWLGVDWIKEPVLRVGEVHHWKRRLLRRFFADPLYMVGNGGFSLRKTRAALKWLSLFHNTAREWQYHEDSFWGIFIRANYPLVRFPKFEKALEFSFEIQPRQCYALNNAKLPFGCHAWWTYDLDFWRPWIEGFGYQLDNEAGMGNESR